MDFTSNLGSGLLSKFMSPPTPDFGSGRLLQGIGGFGLQQASRMPMVNTSYYALKPKPLDFAAMEYAKAVRNGTAGYNGMGEPRNVNQYRAMLTGFGGAYGGLSMQGQTPAFYG